MDKLFVFNKLDWPAWQEEYRRDIRVMVDWDKILTEFVSTEQFIAEFPKVNPRGMLYLPKYSNGDYKTGRPLDLFIANPSLALLRCPAVSYKGRCLILDGYHRAIGIQPKFLVLDVLLLTQKQTQYFADLKMNPTWKKWIKGG